MLYNIGMYRRLTRNIDVRLEGYYTDTDNYISSESHTYPRIYYSDNIDKVWTKGAELELSMSTRAGLGAYFNYNFYIVDWHDDSLEIEPFLMELTPRHRFNTGLTYSLFDNTTISLNSKAAIGRHSKSGLVMDDYVILDFGIEQRLFNQKFMVNFGIENLLNIEYQEIYGYPLPERTITFHTSFSY